MRVPRLNELTARNIAIIYLIVGGMWIFITDNLVAMFITETAFQHWIQTAKGWSYVGGSAVLVYVLAAYRERELQLINDRLVRAIQQITILHRILRHNLRNISNVISGNAELLRTEATDSPRVDAIQTQTRKLIQMIDKARYLRDTVLHENITITPIELVDEIKSAVEQARQTHPDATITTHLPDVAWVSALPTLGFVVNELIENAIIHATTEPTISISVTTTPEWVEFVVEDTGPGIPKMEREVLEQDQERPLSHSQGIGLWIVHTMVSESHGILEITDNAPQGTVVAIALPRSSPPLKRRLPR